MKHILCIGATSAIAQSTLRLLAGAEASFYLLGRDSAKLQHVADDLKVRGAASARIAACDFASSDSIRAALGSLLAGLDQLDLALLAHGSLPDQKRVQEDDVRAAAEIQTNFTSHVLFLTLLANVFETQRSGTIAVIGSVAGDRGRQSNYLYGSCKAGLDAFLSGLRNRLQPANVQVLTIKPGFVDSPMTAHLKQGLLFASTEHVAKDILKAIDRRQDVLYTPFFWRYIMLIIRSIPESVFKKLKL